MAKKVSMGVIRAEEAYSKRELMNRLGISQKFWDKMLDSGLPFATFGHGRWVSGQAVLNYINECSQLKENHSGNEVSDNT